MIDFVILEKKHENSLTTKIILEQEQISETNKNLIKKLEADIDLLTSEANQIISTNTQVSKDLSAEERAVKEIGKHIF